MIEVFADRETVLPRVVGSDISDAVLQAPYDRIRPADVVREGDSLKVSWSIPEHVDDDISVVNSRSFLIAALATVFYRYTGQSPLPMCVSLAGRETSLNMLALQFAISSSVTFSDVECGARDTLAHANLTTNQESPIRFAIADCNIVERMRARADEDASSWIPGTESSDLTFLLVQHPARVEVVANFDRLLFDRSTISSLLAHLLRVMSVAANQPGTRLSDFEILSDAEADGLKKLCTGEFQSLTDEPITKEFERCAERFGNKNAIEFNAEYANYAAANSRANQIAACLTKLDVGVGSHVVVCLAPTLDVPIVLFALFKIGAVYVPLNPDYPDGRKMTILSETNPSLVITSSSNVGSDWLGAVLVFALDDEASLIATQKDSNPDVDVRVQHTASIFYTSGTTGKPKGVMATHGNIVQMLHCSRREFDITHEDVIPAVASFSFSISMFELLSPLTVGGTLRVIERQKITDAKKMSEILSHVSLFHIGPSLLKNIVKYIQHNVTDLTCYDGVRHASSGGDMVPPDLLNSMRRLFTKADIFVLYGCSEISLMGCSYRVPREDIFRTFVGRAYSNVHLLLLDDDDNQVPIRAVGDVCFGGPGVVPGYLDRPELLDSLFVERDGINYYRTGDRGKLTLDGELELLGRRDFQVQIRGMRVEIGEIEYHLRQAPGVLDGVVAAFSSALGETSLVAYCTLETNTAASNELIRGHISEFLPDFMVPANYVWLDELPLNQNLKIDRKSLPEFIPEDRPRATAINLPKSETEKALAEIWSEVLRIGTVGLGDNFLLLGGDSILAMEMIFVVSQRLGVQLHGMDVLRESLQVLAGICDGLVRPKGVPRGDKVLSAIPRLRQKISPTQSFFFGPSATLYGIFSHTSGGIEQQPVLICGPTAHENVRCAFMLKLLAESLANAGAPVLRFDYFGSGDSMGESRDASLQRWQDDIRAAAEELVLRTGAEKIRVLGIRMGSTLATAALRTKVVSTFVAWDPVLDGNSNIVHQRRMHREKTEKLLLIRGLRRPSQINGVEELVGFAYATDTVNEVCRWRSRPDGLLDVAVDTIVLSKPSLGMQAQCPFSVGAGSDGVDVVSLTVDCGWYDSMRVTSAITHRSISNILQEKLLESGDD